MAEVAGNFKITGKLQPTLNPTRNITLAMHILIFTGLGGLTLMLIPAATKATVAGGSGLILLIYVLVRS